MDTQSEYYSDTEQDQFGGTKTDEDADTSTLKSTEDIKATEDIDVDVTSDLDSDDDSDDDIDIDIGILGVSTGIRKPRIRQGHPNPYATKYEITAALAKRAKQIECGAQPTVDTSGLINVNDIAKKELHERKIPIIIERPYPDGTVVKVRVVDLIYPPGF